MRTRSLRVERSKGRVPQARKLPRRPRPSKPRRKPEKPRGSETGRVARTRAGCWATSRHPLRTLETPALLYRGRSPELRKGSGLCMPFCMPSRSLNFGELRVCEVRRIPKRRSSQNAYSTTFVHKEAGARPGTLAPCRSTAVYGRFWFTAVMHVPWSGQPKFLQPPFLHCAFVVGTQCSTVKDACPDRE